METSTVIDPIACSVSFQRNLIVLITESILDRLGLGTTGVAAIYCATSDRILSSADLTCGSGEPR